MGTRHSDQLKRPRYGSLLKLAFEERGDLADRRQFFDFGGIKLDVETLLNRKHQEQLFDRVPVGDIVG